jgi:hypothetical protein
MRGTWVNLKYYTIETEGEEKVLFPDEKFEVSKVVIRSRNSKKDRQHNGQKKWTNYLIN